VFGSPNAANGDEISSEQKRARSQKLRPTKRARSSGEASEPKWFLNTKFAKICGMWPKWPKRPGVSLSLSKHFGSIKPTDSDPPQGT